MFSLLKKLLISPIDWFLYTVLSEEQRGWIASLFTQKQKDFIKKLTSSGKQHTQRQKINRIRFHLYNLGFIERGLTEFKKLLVETKDTAFKRSIAWELAFWHANQGTKADAKKALPYLKQAKLGERSKEKLRRIAIIEAECYQKIGDYKKGREVIEEILEQNSHPDLYLARANLEKTIDQRIYWINQTFKHYQLQPIYLSKQNKQVAYDNLRSKLKDEEITSGPKVSVVLPAYNAESGIQTAIESILSQTWKNIELIIVDDCSTDQTVGVIEGYMEAEQRIRLYSTPENSGPYVARNIGLKNATGEFVTVNDADDWSHTEKIEIQVKHLIDNPSVIANTSEHARLTEEFTLYRRGTPGLYIFSNMSSLMFRRDPVIKKIGYWNQLRFAADGEFKRRLMKVFGDHSVIDLNTGPLSLPRQTIDSLTGSSTYGYDGFLTGARKEYIEALIYHHENSEQLYVPFPAEKLPFPVPVPMKLDGKSRQKVRKFDLLIGADFRMILKEYPQLIEEINQLTDKKIGLFQMGRFTYEPVDELSAEIRQIINGENIQMIVYGEKIKTKDLIIADHLVLADKQRYIPEIQTNQFSVRISHTDKKEQEDFTKMMQNAMDYFGKVGDWYPAHDEVFKRIKHVEKLPIQENKWGELMNHVE